MKTADGFGQVRRHLIALFLRKLPEDEHDDHQKDKDRDHRKNSRLKNTPMAMKTFSSQRMYRGVRFGSRCPK